MSKRTSLAFGDEVASNTRNKVLKKVCNTRWEARHTTVYALKVNYIQVLKSLTNIILTSSKCDEKNTAVSLKKKIESFEFIILMTTWEKVLNHYLKFLKLYRVHKPVYIKV